MDVQHWERIEPLYHAALAKEPGKRSAYLEAACADDPVLRSEVESLLIFADGRLTGPVPRSELANLWGLVAGDAAALATSREAVHAPAAIGRYRIIRLLGEGGMGAVYEAEQQQPCRTVALKVIKPGLATPELLRRFEQESQALGRLQHPGIAQIHEAGTADSGCGPQPYFAMEFIRGESLLRYAEAHRLSARQRLEVMAKICDAVHHAHQRGIIHRDLKPGNILVDESGQPKILDFGVARATDSDAQATHQTNVGQIVGTLAYMSPEQALGDPLELDTRSDVYALGVILYELLAGRPPYQVSPLLPDAVQAIREEDPAPLGSISRVFRGDIETIAAKALEKDKSRRYASASGLAEDIRRYLNYEPIVARPPSVTYQLEKFARRHKGLVTAVLAVFVVLVAGVVASTWEATRANAESATAKALNDFLQNDLLAQAGANTQARPDTRPDPDLKVRTALDRAAARITGRFDRQPLVEASIRQTVGNTYAELGLYAEAQRQMERALQLRRRLLGEKHRETQDTMNSLAWLYREQGRYAQAEPIFAKVLELRRRQRGKEHPDTLTTLADVAVLNLDQGKYAQAEPLLTTVLRARLRVLGEEHADTLATMHNLASLYRDQGKYAQAELLFARVLELRRRVLGEEHPETLISMNTLARVYRFEGKYAQAEPLYTRALELQRRVLGPEHPDTLVTMNNLAVLYRERGTYAQAEPLFTKILEVRRRVSGPEHPETLISMNNLAWLYQGQGKYQLAEPLYTNVVDLQRRLLGEEHPATLTMTNNLARLYHDEGKYARAENLYTKVLEIRRRVLGPEHPATLDTMADLARLYDDLGEYVRAEPLFWQALEVKRRVIGKEHPSTLVSMNSLGLLYTHQGKYAQAELALTEVLEVRRRVLGEAHPDTLISMHHLADLYRLEGKYAQGGQLFTKALELQRRILGADNPNTLNTMHELAVLFMFQTKYAQAEVLVREALAIYDKTKTDTWVRYDCQSLLGASLAGQDRYAEAEAFLLSGYEGITQRNGSVPVASRSRMEEAGKQIIELYQDWGKPEEAASWRQKLQTNRPLQLSKR
jgi:tetratricopeptide (TPR) repeat protein